MMDKTFELPQDKNISWYIDDIVLFSNSKEEMYTLLNSVLKLMNDTGLYLNIENMELLKDSALVLGHIINRYGLRLNPDKAVGIKTAKTAENLKELRGFLEFINYI